MWQTHSNGSKLLFSVDPACFHEDPTKLTKIVVAFLENEHETQSLLDFFPALAIEQLGDGAKTWFATEALKSMEDIKFDETTNTFVMTDDLLMAFLSTKKFRAKVANPLIDLTNAAGNDAGNKERSCYPNNWMKPKRFLYHSLQCHRKRHPRR